MRRIAILTAALGILLAGCGVSGYESPDYEVATIDADVALWRLTAGPDGFIGIGGPVQPGDLAEDAPPMTMGAYHSADGRTWEAGEVFGAIGTPSFGLVSWEGGYAAAGTWDDTPVVLVSDDGSTWQRIALPLDGGAAVDLEAAGIAVAEGTVVVAGFRTAADPPLLWRVGPSGEAGAVDTTGFPAGARLSQAAAGPSGFVFAAAPADDTVAMPPPIWVSSDGSTWDPVLDPFDGDSIVTGLIGSGDGYVAVVADAEDNSRFNLWTSIDGIEWTRRADQDSVFGLLHGTEGDLLTDLTGAPGEVNNRPIAFTFDGRWLEITEAFDGTRFVTVAVAATPTARVVSGFLDEDDPVPTVLVAEG
jgi:hypothetical protein